MGKLQITQVKSSIGRLPAQKATLEALGLKRIHTTVTQVDNKCIRGMIQAVHHLVKVEEVQS